MFIIASNGKKISAHETKRGAAISLAALKRNDDIREEKGYYNNHYKKPVYEIMTWQQFHDADIMVEVINLQSGMPCMIRRSDRGGCCDPSTETYHSI